MPTTFVLLGCTHPHSRGHLATLRLSPRVDRFWIWDPDLRAAMALGEHAGPKLAGVSADLTSILREGSQFALVCRRNDENPATVIAALRAGKHVLSEKPMAITSEALRPVLDEALRAGVALGVYYPWRCHPAAQDLQALIRQGVLGRLLAMEARMVTSQVKFRDPEHWLFRRRYSGGGVLHWLGCHYFDLLRYLSGEEVTHVSALTGVLNGFPIEVEDTASVSMRWSSGAIGTLTAGYHLARSGGGYFGAAYDTYLAARGMEGSFRWAPTRANEVVAVESAHPSWSAAPERELRYQLEPSEAYGGRYGMEFLHRFIDSATSGRAVPAGGEDALRMLEWVEAVYRSAESGETVRLA
ncbi:MAG: dehydrogenase [Armatimonadetes bacterium]|nr:dehydrogenase [Armatimonadota bacterium]